MTKVAIISDTHGLLRPQVVHSLQGVQHIIHGGDLGDMQILAPLEEIAPVTIVRGNVDHGPGLANLPLTNVIKIEEFSFYIIHILQDLDINPVVAGIDVVVFGHTHKPDLYTRNGVRYLNPGSIGPRRFSLPISMAMVEISGQTIDIKHITFND